MTIGVAVRTTGFASCKESWKLARRVGRDYLFGVRLSAADFNHSPLQLSLLRFPSVLRSRQSWTGNDITQMLVYAKRLRELSVDFLHVVAGYGFPNPRDTPGPFPFDEIRDVLQFHAASQSEGGCARHAGERASYRPRAMVPEPWLDYQPGINLDYAGIFKKGTGMPVIANGGFQEKDFIEGAIDSQRCDMVSMARALIANPDLPAVYKAGKNAPERPCSHCNKCVGRTVTSPLGCYDVKRFASQKEMQDQIMAWNRPDPA